MGFLELFASQAEFVPATLKFNLKTLDLVGSILERIAHVFYIIGTTQAFTSAHAFTPRIAMTFGIISVQNVFHPCGLKLTSSPSGLVQSSRLYS